MLKAKTFKMVGEKEGIKDLSRERGLVSQSRIIFRRGWIILKRGFKFERKVWGIARVFFEESC